MQDIYFKEGDKVSHQGLGNGVVTKIEGNNNHYPLYAVFNGVERMFTIDGKIYLEDLYPSLFQGHDRFTTHGLISRFLSRSKGIWFGLSLMVVGLSVTLLS